MKRIWSVLAMLSTSFPIAGGVCRSNCAIRN
jgi:hypothetical protein